MLGVVSLPHGFGHARDGVRLGVASIQQPGASANDLTCRDELDAVSGNAAVNGLAVEVRSAGMPAILGELEVAHTPKSLA
jgi:hypothetical protein